MIVEKGGEERRRDVVESVVTTAVAISYSLESEDQNSNSGFLLVSDFVLL